MVYLRTADEVSLSTFVHPIQQDFNKKQVQQDFNKKQVLIPKFIISYPRTQREHLCKFIYVHHKSKKKG